jgi:hypothetical protein
MRPLTVSIALLAAITGGDAHAGLVITMSQTVDGVSPAIQTIYLDAGRVRIPTPDGYVIYRGISENTVIVNMDEREYSVISSQQQAYSEKNVQLFDQEEANGSLEIEAYRHHAFLSYAKAGPVRAIGRWSCAPYKMLVNFQPRAELCISKLSDLGLTTEELQDLYRLERVLGQIIFQRERQHTALDWLYLGKIRQSIGYDGFPVQTVDLATAGTVNLKVTLVSIRRAKLPDNLFQAPAGYRLTTLASTRH